MKRDKTGTQTRDRFASEPVAPGVGQVPALTIAYHPDLARGGERAALISLTPGRPTQLSREAPVFAHPGTHKLDPLAESCISRTPIMLTRGSEGGIDIALDQSRTKLVYRSKSLKGVLSLTRSDLARGAVLELGGGIVLVAHFVDGNSVAREDDTGLVGESDGIHRVRSDLRRVADLDFAVLIRGETGTGKELVARAIHETGPRREGPFVAVNLAAIPPSLAISELFGAEKGAYTGAVRTHAGYFEAARGGTLFLDEIGEAPPELQVALLRALETGEVQGVGAARARKADVRVLAATDADLESKIQDGTFRAPLLHRLAGYEIWMPPLRERREDIARLLLRFLGDELSAMGEPDKLAQSDPPWLPASLVARLVDFEWPGNVRQLRNVARQLVVGGRGKSRLEVGPAVERLLEVGAIPKPTPQAVPTPATRPLSGGGSADRRKPADVTEAELKAALRACRWDLAATAEKLLVSRASMYVLIERTPGLRTAGDLTAEEIAKAHRESGGDIQRMVERLEVSERALRRRIREIGLDSL